MSIYEKENENNISQEEKITQICEYLKWLDHPAFEIRQTKCRDGYKKTRIGYFTDDAISEAAYQILANEVYLPVGTYVTLNQIPFDLLARSENKFGADNASKDNEIERIKHILIDVDSNRLSEMMANEDERKQSHIVFLQVVQFLEENKITGFGAIDTGSGFAIIIKCDLETNESKKVSELLQLLDEKFGNENSSIDISVFNPSRITRVPGTLNAKGSNSELTQRIYRTAQIIHLPKEKNEISINEIDKLISKLKQENKREQDNTVEEKPKTSSFEQLEQLDRQQKPENKGNQKANDFLLGFFYRHQIEHQEKNSSQASSCYSVECPFCENEATVSIIDEKIGYKCFHSSVANCSTDKHWKDYRSHYEPEYQSESKPVDEETFEEYPTSKPKASSKITKDFLLRYDQFCNLAENEPVDWWIEYWLEFGSLGMLTGNTGAGKSYIITEILTKMAQKQQWANKTVQRTPFLLIDLENKYRIMQKRINNYTLENNPALQDVFTTIDKSKLSQLLPLNPDSIRTLIEITKEIYQTNKLVVIIDTMRSAFAESDVDPDQMRNLLYPLQRIAQETNSAMLILHHRPKNGAGYSGSTALAGTLDYMWKWEREENSKQGKLSLSKTRDDAQSPLHFQFDSQTQTNEFLIESPAGDQRKLSADLRYLIQCRDLFAGNIFVPFDTIKKYLMEKNDKEISNPRFSQMKSKWIENKYVTEDNGNYHNKKLSLTNAGKDVVASM